MCKERILLKLSGANLKSEAEDRIFNHEKLSHLSDQIKELSQDYAVALVIGGGNIWRGAENVLKPIDAQDAHVIGMLSTLINAVALQNYLKFIGVKSIIFSSFSCQRIAEDIATDRVDRALNEGNVVIFAAGTGMPFVSTDTCAAVRSLEINASRIFIGKNGIKGVYDSDPKENKDAKFFDKITYEEIIERRLSAMDLSSMLLLKNNSRPKLIVFNQTVENAFIRAAKGDIECTEIV